jgi:hypothetical protein
VVGKFKDRLSVSKRATQRFGKNGFNSKRLNNAIVTEQHQVRFSASKVLDRNVNEASGSITDNTKTSQ